MHTHTHTGMIQVIGVIVTPSAFASQTAVG